VTAQSGSSGNAVFNLQKRTLALKPGAADVRVAVFSGSALQSPTPDALAYLRQTQADVFIVLGGLGRSNAQALETTRALASLERLVLVLRGGADGFDHGLTAAPRVLDASALRSVRIGQDNLLLWSGSEHGRYALTPAHCGFDQADLEVALEELGAQEPSERRLLLTWQAPEPSSPLAAFAARAGVAGVLYAWPSLAEPGRSAGNPTEPQLVPRGWGPRLEDAHGRAIELGVLVVRFDRDGPHIVR
jgi:hypothetical protein